ncbi:BgiBsFReDn1 [Biomphalaria glabrata]|nr:BgiBsFReDn1 [Biomphalaria glabrata]
MESKVCFIFIIAAFWKPAFMEDVYSCTKDNILRTIANFSCDPITRLDTAMTTLMSSLAAVNKRIDDECLKNVIPDSCRNVYSAASYQSVIFSSGLKVMCDTKTDGGGWIIIQRRINGNVDFYKTWKEYRDGFGDIENGDFYLGNENIYMLTSKRQYELRVDLEFSNKRYYAKYASFQLGAENDGYRLSVQGYSGNMTDNLAYSNNRKFTTFDQDHDDYAGNCALDYTGGWWYGSCTEANLNGMYGRTTYKGLLWVSLTSLSGGITFAEMKIREK